MIREEALKILGFSGNSSEGGRVLSPSIQEIDSRYFRLIRRYPREVFPEKFSQVARAYEVLSDPLSAIRDLLEKDSVDFAIFDLERHISETESVGKTFEGWFSHINHDPDATQHQALIMRLLNQWQDTYLHSILDKHGSSQLGSMDNEDDDLLDDILFGPAE